MAANRAPKLFQGHRFGVAASARVVAALKLGIAGTSAGLMQARRAEPQEDPRFQALVEHARANAVAARR